MCLKILVVTAMYPRFGKESSGAFVMQQVEQLRTLGHDVETIDFPGHRSKLEYAKAAFVVAHQTRRKRDDVVHAHYGVTGLCTLMRNATPMVISLHGSDALVGWIEPLISRVVCALADATIVVSKAIARRIPGTVIPCGVDLALFQPKPRTAARQHLGLLPACKYILFPFDPARRVKRFDIASGTIKELAARNVELLTVSKVHYTEMPWYYSAADAMILCSDSEGSPTSVKEALACNLPVVSTDVGDVREIVRGVVGTQICTREVGALAHGLREALNISRSGGFEGRAAMAKYDQASTIEKVIGVYNDVLCTFKTRGVQRRLHRPWEGTRRR